MIDHEVLEPALKATGWELIGWFAFQEASRVRNALMDVEEGDQILRQGPPDPRADPDYYHLADLI